MTAYDLTMAALHLVDRMEEEGVDPAEIEAWFGEGSEAIERRRYVVKRLEIERQASKDEAARFADRARRLDAEIEQVRAGALSILVAKGLLGEEPKIQTPNVSAWLVETVSAVGPDDVTAWPGEYRRLRTTETADKEAAREALLAGLDVPGVRLERRQSLRWR